MMNRNLWTLLLLVTLCIGAMKNDGTLERLCAKYGLMLKYVPDHDRLLGSLSDPSVELMSHGFRYVGEYGGWHYGLYNAGYKTTKEHPANLDIDLKLSRWKTGDIAHREISQIWYTGKGISDDFRPPYDATGYIEGSVLHILFCPGVNGSGTYVHVPYNLDTQEPGHEETMTLDGQEMNVANVIDNYKARTGKDIPWFTDGGAKTAFGIGMNVEIARHKGSYYCVISALAHGFTAIIVRSEDLVHWETVAIPDLSPLNFGTTWWEGAVHPLHGDVFAFTARVQSEDGVVYGTWDASTGALSNLQLIEGGITSHPEFFEYKGNTYFFCNTFGPSDVEGYGSVYRSTVSFYKLSPDGSSLEFVRSKFVPEGIHYATFYVEPGHGLFGRRRRGDRLYIIYSTDSRRLDHLEGRSNIAIEELAGFDPDNDGRGNLEP